MHGHYARVTPFELSFPEDSVAEERLRRIREEAVERGEESSLVDPGRFVALPAVAETLQKIRDPGGDAEGLQKHAVLLYHLFHFHQAGRPLYLLTMHAARYLVEAGDTEGGDVPPTPPEAAGYLQLPRHLFWVEPTEEGPPEPVDGIFWSAPEGERMAVLVTAGLREDRPGFSVVPLPALPLADAPVWVDADVRETGADFESTLPGGELDRLYSLEAAGEVLKLLARVFRYLRQVPEAVDQRPPPGPPEEEPGSEHPEEPRPSGLPYRRIELSGDP